MTILKTAARETMLVHNWFVFATCLVGNCISVCFEFYCLARFLSLRGTPEHYSFITKQQQTCTLLVVLIIRIVIHSVHYLSSHSIKAVS